MNKIMYLMNFDWEGFKKGDFCVKINNKDTELMINFEHYALSNKIILIKNNSSDKCNTFMFGTCRLAENDIPVYVLSDEIPPLTFLGRGSAFNTKEGNTAAYFKYDNNKKMFLIDCGSTVFSKIMESNVLDGVKELDVAITHLHPDHVGSLGDLIFYMYYKKGIIVNLYIPDVNKPFRYYEFDIFSYLAIQGIRIYMMNIKSESDISNPFIINITRNNFHHKGIRSYFITIINNMNNNGKVPKRIHYTGDVRVLITNHTVMINNNKDIIEQVYIEACEPDKGCNVHLPIDKLIEFIPVEYRSYYTIMHFDSDKTIQMARNAGFNIAGEEPKKNDKNFVNEFSDHRIDSMNTDFKDNKNDIIKYINSCYTRNIELMNMSGDEYLHPLRSHDMFSDIINILKPTIIEVIDNGYCKGKCNNYLCISFNDTKELILTTGQNKHNDIFLKLIIRDSLSSIPECSETYVLYRNCTLIQCDYYYYGDHSMILDFNNPNIRATRDFIRLY